MADPGYSVRPLSENDLDVVVRLYAELDRRDPARPSDGYRRFFADVLFGIGSDPRLPSLVCEAPTGETVGFIASHPRRLRFQSRDLSAACFGPIIVDDRHRGHGLAALLFDAFLKRSQELTFNDRAIGQVSRMWQRRGGVVDQLASMEWVYRLRPAGEAIAAVVPRRLGLRRLPGRDTLAAMERPVVRRRSPEPVEGGSAPLSPDGVIDALDRLAAEFDLRPVYEPDYLRWLFAAMEGVVLGGRLSRRLITRDDGVVAGYYVMYVLPHGSANVIQLAAGADDAGLVLDHAIHDAGVGGAIDIRGRLESFLLPHLRARGCGLEFGDLVGIQSAEGAIPAAVLGGRSLVSRLDGEWWMRPRPEAPPDVLSSRA